MIVFACLKAWLFNVTDVFASDEFNGVEERQRARQDMRNLRWRRYENRWVDGY